MLANDIWPQESKLCGVANLNWTKKPEPGKII